MSSKKKTRGTVGCCRCGNPLPKAYSQYGASMGRRTTGAVVPELKLYLSRVKLDRGGYDSGGAYWGAGAPLWRVSDAEDFETFLRASDREAAKRKILADVPGARFHR